MCSTKNNPFSYFAILKLDFSICKIFYYVFVFEHEPFILNVRHKELVRRACKLSKLLLLLRWKIIDAEKLQNPITMFSLHIVYVLTIILKLKLFENYSKDMTSYTFNVVWSKFIKFYKDSLKIHFVVHWHNSNTLKR